MFSLLLLLLPSNHYITASIVFQNPHIIILLSCLKFSRAFPLHLGKKPELLLLATTLFLLLLPTSPSSSHITLCLFHYALATLENFVFTSMSRCFRVRVFPYTTLLLIMHDDRILFDIHTSTSHTTRKLSMTV